MNWKREQPGVYTCGPYRVERQPYHRAIWIADGPGIAEGSGVHDQKADAQTECADAALERISGRSHDCTAVAGDIVMVRDRRGQIGTIMEGAGPRSARLYCIRFVRGKRLCLFRDEFEVVLP